MQDEMPASTFSLHFSCITPLSFSEVLFNVIVILQFGSLQKAWMVSLAVKVLAPSPEDSSVPGSKWWSQESICFYSGETVLRSICTLKNEGHCAGDLHHHRQLLDMEKGQWNKDRISELEVQLSLFLRKVKKCVCRHFHLYVGIGQCLLLNWTQNHVQGCDRRSSWTPLLLMNRRRKSWWKHKSDAQHSLKALLLNCCMYIVLTFGFPRTGNTKLTKRWSSYSLKYGHLLGKPGGSLKLWLQMWIISVLSSVKVVSTFGTREKNPICGLDSQARVCNPADKPWTCLLSEPVCRTDGASSL